MESPTYSGAIALARFAGVRIVELPMGPEGPDPEALLGEKVKLVYLMPERQNPTGVTASRERREALLKAVASTGALLIEDGYEEPESGMAPLAARLPDRTVWLGTLSKDLVPGFRIVWIAGPAPVIEPAGQDQESGTVLAEAGFQVSGWGQRELADSADTHGLELRSGHPAHAPEARHRQGRQE